MSGDNSLMRHWAATAHSDSGAKLAYVSYADQSLVAVFQSDEFFGYRFLDASSCRIDLERCCDDKGKAAFGFESNRRTFVVRAQVGSFAFSVTYGGAIPLPEDSPGIRKAYEGAATDHIEWGQESPRCTSASKRRFRLRPSELTQALWEDSAIFSLQFQQGEMRVLIRDYGGEPGLLYFVDTQAFELVAYGVICPEYADASRVGGRWNLSVQADEQLVLSIDYADIYVSAV